MDKKQSLTVDNAQQEEWSMVTLEDATRMLEFYQGDLKSGIFSNPNVSSMSTIKDPNEPGGYTLEVGLIKMEEQLKAVGKTSDVGLVVPTHLEIRDSKGVTGKQLEIKIAEVGVAEFLKSKDKGTRSDYFVRPLTGGVSIGIGSGPDGEERVDMGAGTLGYAVWLKPDGNNPTDPNLYGLTCWHVVTPGHQTDDRVYQPAVMDGGGKSPDDIGYADRAANTDDVDAAIIRLRENFREEFSPGLHHGDLGGYDAYPITMREFPDDDKVFKSGRTTGYTEGEVHSRDATVAIGLKRRMFYHQISTCDHMSDSGDSGSILWLKPEGEATAKPFGLVFAGNPGRTYANQLHRVFANPELNIDRLYSG